jgi:hypothetical protein
MLAFGTVIAGRVAGFEMFGRTELDAIAGVATEPRYHYVPTMLLAAVLAVASEAAASRGRRWRYVVTAVLLVGVAGLTLQLPWAHALAERFQGIRRMFAGHHVVLEKVEAEARRSTSPVVYVTNQAVPGVGPMHSTVLPGWAAIFLIYHPDGTVGGRVVRFVESNETLLAELRAQPGPISRVVVSPTEVPAQPR